MLGLLGWGIRVRDRFFTPLTSTSSILAPPRAYPGTTATFSRASAQYITDFEGVTRKVESGSVAVEGSRVVTNLLTYSEDLSNAVWNVEGPASKSGNTIIFTGGGSVSHYVTASCVVGSLFRYNVKLSGNGTVTLRVRDNNFTGAITDKTVTLSATPTLFSMTYTPTNNTTGVICYLLYGTATPVTLHSAQLENVTDQTNTNPGEYVKTTSAAVTKCFATTNGNTVDANGVVTEATGTSLPTSYPERVNTNTYGLNDRIQVAGWWYQCTTLGISAGSAPAFPQGKAGNQTVTDGSAVWTIGGRLLLGYVSEPASTNKVTAYGIIPADTFGSELSSGSLTIGQKYQITARTDANFVADGAADNNVGTQFVATAATVTLDAGDKVKRVQWGVGEKSFHNGSSFVQNITGLTLSGDTAAVLSIVTDQAEIEKAGLAGINPGFKVYKLDNSLGSTVSVVTILGSYGNTNKHSDSIIYRLNAPPPMYRDPRLCDTYGTFNSSFTSLTYSRKKVENITPANSSAALALVADAETIVFFILPQLEELPYATSVMPTAGATATRAATSLSYPTAGNLMCNNVTVGIEATPYALSSDFVAMFYSYNSADIYLAGYLALNKPVFNKRITTSYYASSGDTVTANSTFKFIGKLSSATGVSMFISGTKGPNLSTNTLPATIGNSLTIGTDGASAIYSVPFKGYLRNFKIWFKPLSDYRCKALTQ